MENVRLDVYEMALRRRRRDGMVYAVTSCISLKLARGQLSMLQENVSSPVHVVSGPGGEADAASEGVAFHSVAMKREVSLRDLWSVYRMIETYLRIRPELSVVSTPKAGLLGGVAAVVTGVPRRVYVCRGLRLETASGVQRMILWVAEWLACSTAHRVYCVSSSLKDRLTESGLCPEGKVRVIGSGSSNGLDWDRFGPSERNAASASAWRQHLAIDPETFILGYVGRLAADKGTADLPVIVELVARGMRREIALIVVGPVEDKMQVAGSSSRVIYVGPLENPEEIYGAFDVLIFPTRREGFPNVILEAAGAAVPAVGYRVTGVVDAVLDGVTGSLVKTGDCVAAAEACLAYANDADLLKSHGSLAQDRALSDFEATMFRREFCKDLKRFVESYDD